MFYENLQWTLTKISASGILCACGDFNGHTGKNADGYHGVNGGRGFGRHNLEGEIILEFAAAHNLVVSNSLFTKKGESSGNITIWWKSKSDWLHLGKAAEYQISVRCESYLKWRVCNPVQTTCLKCKNCKMWRSV